MKPVVTALQKDGGRTTIVTSCDEAAAAMEQMEAGVAYAPFSVGLDALQRLFRLVELRGKSLWVVVIGQTGTVHEAVSALQLGASDYLVPGFASEAVLTSLERLRQRSPTRSRTVPSTPVFSSFVGSSEAISRVLATIEKISRYKANVLVLGESGTGKELIARALHASGPRRKNLFVPLNCATLSRELLENELFGHEKGAYTGANERKKGLFELADGGTLFLDEIGEMDVATQAKLLRVLERCEFRRVGGHEKVRIDLSIVAATNKNLEAAIRQGRFRNDLYYRLKVVTIQVPPLRQRREDIPSLVESFIRDFNDRNGGKISGIAPSAMKLMMEYEWPGNVRELKNAVESLAILSAGETITTEAFMELGTKLPASDSEPREPPVSSRAGGIFIEDGSTLASAERRLILEAIARHPSKRSAASALGIGLRTLYSKLEKFRSAGGETK